jgi:16S rRNA (guanine966-N2)-methyltransferase
MRIIAGRLGGLHFEAPKGNQTHPMSDRARGGLFSALGDIEGLSVLDAFAGSGALSFEAISRGAKSATAIEVDFGSIRVINKNVMTLKLNNQINVIKKNCSIWSDKNTEVQFDIVIAAPPYNDLRLKILQKLVRHAKPGGLYILDWPAKLDAPEFQYLEKIKSKNYSAAQLVFYRKIG